jgi:hypothetical protein
MGKILIMGLLLLTTGFLMQFSSLHNIDLSWNVKHLNLVDDNGIITQDVTSMYQNGFRNLWISPFFFVFGTYFIQRGIKNG